VLKFLSNERKTILIKALRFKFDLLVLSVTLRIDHPETRLGARAPTTLLLLIKLSDV
jgi:hypothetical protein